MRAFKSRVVDSFPGSIDLTPEDKTSLHTLLENNTGSKDDIKEIREWIMARCHSLIAVGVELNSFVKKKYSSMCCPESFSKIFYTIYVINDLFFNGAGATTSGLYTSVVNETRPVDLAGCIVPQLPNLMNIAYCSCCSDNDRDKLMKIVMLWESKAFIDRAQCANLKSAMTAPLGHKIVAPIPELACPFPVDLPHFAMGTIPHSALHNNPADRNTHFKASPPSAPLECNYPGVLEISQMSVGLMADAARANLEVGCAAYSPLNLHIVTGSPLCPPQSMGGRAPVEAAITEYLKKVDEIISSSY